MHLKNKNVIQKINIFQILKIVIVLFSIQLSCQIDHEVLVYKLLQKFLLGGDVVVFILKRCEGIIKLITKSNYNQQHHLAVPFYYLGYLEDAKNRKGLGKDFLAKA